MARKKYNIKLASRADKMMLSHTEFLAKASPDAARKLLAEFKKAIKRIDDNPLQFPFADEIDVPGILPRTYRKCLIRQRYKALFLVEGNDVFIDAIIDCRQENLDVFPTTFPHSP
jgi:plasmid stabilization system protein ParE